jgi:muconate cycloisomerase
MTKVTIGQHLAPHLIGKDPTNINEVHRAMDAMIRGNHVPKAALEIACHDLFGKAYNMPVHQILGGKRRDTMRCMWSIGGSTPEESAADVLNAKAAGYDGCMIKIGGPDYKLDAARTIAVREAVGKEYPLIVDANQGWDVDTAIRYAKLIKDCDILFFEQPVQSWDVDGMAKVHRTIDIPLSADEGVMTLQDAKHLVQKDAVDIFSIKVTKNGGIQPAKAICEYADANGIGVFFNSMIEEGITQAASLQIAATCTNIVTTIGHAFFSPYRLDGDICSYYQQVKPQEGKVRITDRPGLGIDVEEAAMDKYRVNRVTVE